MTPSTTLHPAVPAVDEKTEARSPGGFFMLWFPWVLLATTLAATVLLALSAQGDAEVKARAVFERRATALQESISERMRAYQQILRGVTGLFNATDKVGLDQWTGYINTLDLGHQLPGMLTVGYAEFVTRAELPAYLARARREIAPEFDIVPPGDRDAYAPVTYQGQRLRSKSVARGWDLLTDPVRREALARARATGRTAVSAKLRLLDGDDPTGFLMLLPVPRAAVRADASSSTPTGVIVGVFRMRELMAGVIGQDLPDIDLRIYDGTVPTEPALLYKDDSIERQSHGGYTPAFATSRTLTLGDHQWTIHVTSLPYRAAVTELYKPAAIAVAGTIVSLLLFIMAFSLARSGERAERLAASMTAAARASEAKFRSYVERAPLGVLVADARGSILECNQAAADLLGCTPETCREVEVLERCSPEDREAAAATLRDLAQHGEMEAEWRLTRPDSKVLWLQWRAVRFPDGRFLAFCQDVTQRRNDADALRESESRALSASRMKSEFLASMSHELRTPLTSIRGFSELMERRSQNAVLKEQAGIIRRAAEHLTALLNDILDMSKVEAGAMQIVPKPTSVRKIATDTVELFRSAAEAKGLALNASVSIDIPRAAMWDSLRVKQVLNNLLSNAIKFTPRGWVRLDVNVVDDCVRFDVTDTGPGIAPEAQALVFERFRQADDRVAHQYGGTGLGLALALSLARLMGGTLALSSEVGRGSCFTLTLPVGLGPESAATVELVSTDQMAVHATSAHAITF
jgi:PAS domain S-box-containing protein